MRLSYRRSRKKSLVAPIVLLVFSITAAGLGLALLAGAENSPITGFMAQPAETTLPAETEPVAEPEVVPAIQAGGKADDVRYAASYTADSARAAELAGRQVASAGEAVLTNGELQVYYLRQIADWKNAEHEQSPDFSVPLESQLCPLGSGELSWQHYFLEKALLAWQLEASAVQAVSEPIPLKDDSYRKIDQWADYITEDLPVNDFLYADRDCYTPNQLHQAWLDAIPGTLDDLAAALGYTDASDYAGMCGISAETLQSLASDTNLAYMYMTEMTFEAEEDPESLSYVPEGGKVDLRHALLIPEGARVAANGTVTAQESAWTDCRKLADELVKGWQYDWGGSQDRDSAFARMANANSADAGSAFNGGLYSHISKGDLIDELDSWAFADGRRPGDWDIIRSPLGIHIVYLSAAYDPDVTEEQRAAMEGAFRALDEQLRNKNALKTDFSAIALWVSPEAAAMSTDAILYPDIAHERFPEAITYLQQDYYYHPYGFTTVGPSGCGITTFAILATYMTDKLQTPAMMADRFSYYSVEGGTNGDLFKYGSSEMGFFLDEGTGDLDKMTEALQNGQRVIVLENQGHFTRGGHYLFIQRYNEDGTYQIRDSNIYNYARLSGHRIDCFTRENILSGLNTGYILQAKIVRSPVCGRCGGTFTETAPQRLLNTGYTCLKCQAALARRDSFLELVG